MTKLNIKKTIALAVASLLSLGSCKDFLDVKPEGSRLTQTDFFKTQDDAVRATNACYAILRRVEYNFGFYPITEIMSDNARKGSSPGDQAGELDPYENFTFTANAQLPLAWYNILYLGIRRCNAITDFVPGIPMNEGLKTRLLAEARCLRGSHYLDLFRGFGPTPLVLVSQSPRGLKRPTDAEVIAQIELDLQFAAANLPQNGEYGSGDLGRVTKGTAQALLGRLYLWTKQYEKAATVLQEVVGSDKYSLEPDFSNAFRPAGNYGPESVWEVPSIAIVANFESGGNQYGQTEGVRGVPNKGWGFNRPTPDLMASFEPGDSRLEKTVIRLGEVIDGITILGHGETPDTTRDAAGNVIEIEVYNEKVWVPGTTPLESWDLNRKLIRYADVLLMLAEALNEAGRSDQALQYLELVRARARAGQPGVLPQITETNQSALRDIIHHERRVELAMEGQRFFDLVRTGKAEAVLGPLGFKPNKNERLPIPQTERDITGGVITQNPGY